MTAAPQSGLLLRWLQRILIAAITWTAIGLVFALPSLTAGGPWQRSLLASLAQWWSWGAMAFLIVAVDKRLPFTSRQMAGRIITHLCLSPIFTAAYIYLFAAVLALLRLNSWSQLRNSRLLLNAFRGMFLWSALVYCLIVGVWQAYLYHQRYLSGELRVERLERSFAEARLNALRMQLDPHFLFNALNTISSQVEREPRLTRQMIEHLGDLLRLSLENKDRQEVALAEEIAFLDHYLAIQQIRFGDRLKFESRVDPKLRYTLVPGLILQPLVENAIRHGISIRASGGSVVFSARELGDQLELRVADDGVGLPQGWSLESSPGLGLTVTRERILGLYGSAGRMAVRRLRSGGTEAVILLPLRFAAPSQSDQSDGATHGTAAD
jgi:two-component system, LytTR family, sensor kinase